MSMLFKLGEPGSEGIPSYLQLLEKRLEALILLHGITEVGARFSGSGDSGQMDDIWIKLKGQDQALNPADVPCAVELVSKIVRFDPVAQAWINDEQTDIVGLTELIEAIIEAYFNEFSFTGYENGDGGGGEWRWTPATGVSCRCYYNELIERDQYQSDGKPLGEAPDHTC